MFDDELQLPASSRNKYILDVTNLIDLLIILIIFLIATTTFSRIGIQIHQPKAQFYSRSPAVSMQIDIDSNGHCYVNKAPILDQELGAVVKTKLGISPNLVVILNADKSTPTQLLIKVLDRCKLAGAERFSFAVEAAHQ